jgi:putative nucleotidyltransferase with HDIG domain
VDSARLLSLVVVGAVNIVLALAVYLRDSRNRANRAFAATVIASIVWLAFAFLSDQPQLSQHALLLNRLTFATSMIMGVALVYFALVFPNRKNRIGGAWVAYLALGGVIAAMTVATPLVVAGVVSRSYGTDVQSGIGFVAYTAWMLGGIAAIFYVLIRKYRVVTGREKAQLKFIFLGVAQFTVLSITFGLLLPTLIGSYAPAVLNTFTPLVLFGFTSYAMIKHRLMDMRVVVLRGVLYSILVALVAAFYLVLAQIVRMQILAGLGISADAAFVIGGLVAVFAFQPLRVLLENVTDHIFYRRRYDQQTLLERLSEQLVGTADPSEIAAAVAEVLGEQMKVAKVALVHDEAGELVAYGEGIGTDDSALAELIAASPTVHPVLAEELVEGSPIAVLLADRGIQVVVPLVIEGSARAALLLGEKRSGEVYTSQDLRFLQMLSPEIAIALKTADLFEQREQRVRELTALNKLASVLGQDIQLEALLNRALSQVVKVAGADSGSIMLLDSGSQTLSVRASHGLAAEVVRETRVAVGERIAGWVAQHRTSLLMLDEGLSPFAPDMEQEAGRSALSVPLVSKERVIGVLNISRVGSSASFSQENMSIVTSFAAQLAVAIENAQLYSELEGHVLGTISALTAAVEAKDPYTFGHSSEVTEGALAIAAEMGLDPQQTNVLRTAAILHDIGKIGIDGAILGKTGPLSEEEFAAIRRHPTIAANILSSLDFLDDVVPLVLHHHERYDGAGYPAGIAGEDIPLGARIICVADSYDAMTSDRTYRRALPKELALQELTRHAGKQFDPDVVAAYLRVLERGEAAGGSEDSAHHRDKAHTA